MSKPLVSFLMPTHGRAAVQPGLLNEAVYWFTQQDICQQCELVILNDVPDQELVCQVGNVRVVNHPKPYRNLGSKMNALVELARADVCCVWEDDDISLPWRSSQAVERLAECQFWEPGVWWYAQKGQRPVADGRGVGHTSSAFRKSALRNQYPNLTQGHDAVVQQWARENLICNLHKLESPTWISYVYRWGYSLHHVSSQPDMERSFRETPVGKPGRYEIIPHAGVDWVMECKLRGDVSRHPWPSQSPQRPRPCRLAANPVRSK